MIKKLEPLRAEQVRETIMQMAQVKASSSGGLVLNSIVIIKRVKSLRGPLVQLRELCPRGRELHAAFNFCISFM